MAPTRSSSTIVLLRPPSAPFPTRVHLRRFWSQGAQSYLADVKTYKGNAERRFAYVKGSYKKGDRHTKHHDGRGGMILLPIPQDLLEGNPYTVRKGYVTWRLSTQLGQALKRAGARVMAINKGVGAIEGRG